MPLVTQAATYYTNYEFKVAINSSNYSFNKGTVSLKTYDKYTTGWTSAMPTTFSITMYDSNGKAVESTKVQNRWNNETSKWTVPSKGKYWFRWVKANDGSTAYGNVEIVN